MSTKTEWPIGSSEEDDREKAERLRAEPAPQLRAPAPQASEPVATYRGSDIGCMYDIIQVHTTMNTVTKPEWLQLHSPAPQPCERCAELERCVPEWSAGYPTNPWDKEEFIAQTTFTDKVVLKALPEEYSYDFTTADGTYITKENVVRWMQFPASEFVSPSQSKLAALEAENARLSEKITEYDRRIVAIGGIAMNSIPKNSYEGMVATQAAMIVDRDNTIAQQADHLSDAQAIIQRMMKERKQLTEQLAAAQKEGK